MNFSVHYILLEDLSEIHSKGKMGSVPTILVHCTELL